MNIQKSDYYILDILWENGDMKASQIANILEKNIGWNKNTTYTIINRCVKKEYIKRIDPGYVCRAMITKKQATESNVNDVMNRFFNGSFCSFVSNFVSSHELSSEEIQELDKIISNARKKK